MILQKFSESNRDFAENSVTTDEIYPFKILLKSTVDLNGGFFK